MAEAYQKQLDEPEARGLNFEERFGMLVDSHWTWRENQALVRRLKKSKLSAEPCVEDINYRYPRQMDPSTVRGLTNSQWVIQHLNVLFTGPTGIGKTWIAPVSYTHLRIRKKTGCPKYPKLHLLSLKSK